MTVLLEGFHAVKHALRFAPELVTHVEVADRERVRGLAERLAPDVLELLLGRAVAGPVPHHTGVQAWAQRPEPDVSVLASRAAPFVLLDRPRHPGNVGAVIRVAAAAGASGVGVVGDLDPWAPAVLRGSAGLHYALPVLAVDIGAVVSGAVVSGAVVVLDAGGDPYAVVPSDAVVVVGSERGGVGDVLRARADLTVALPMRAGVSSLNLATAVAAVLYGRQASR